MLIERPIPYQNIEFQSHQVTVKRIDQVNETVSGNKFYKLKYNLQYAKKHGYKKIVSFGGAYSNHIYALAQACSEGGLECVGIIRGEELANKPFNPTLSDVSALGMQLQFISREQYRQKDTPQFLASLKQQYPDAYFIPEGGSNDLAIKGTGDILNLDDTINYDCIFCAVGTGGTIAGIINASNPQQQIIGFSALNSTYQKQDIKNWSDKNNWTLYPDDIFGGYGRYNDELIQFMNHMAVDQQLPLEPIYTAKALYRLFRLLDQQPTLTNALFIHTGGLQGYQRH